MSHDFNFHHQRWKLKIFSLFTRYQSELESKTLDPPTHTHNQKSDISWKSVSKLLKMQSRNAQTEQQTQTQTNDRQTTALHHFLRESPHIACCVSHTRHYGICHPTCCFPVPLCGGHCHNRLWQWATHWEWSGRTPGVLCWWGEHGTRLWWNEYDTSICQWCEYHAGDN